MTERLAKNTTSGQFVRFILVGVANTAVGYLVYAAFVLLGIGPQLALAMAFVIGVIWNFWAHARLVFGQGGMGLFPAYVGVYVAIWGLNAVVLHLAIGAGFGPLLAQALLAPVSAVLSFFFIARVLTGSFPLAGKKAS